MLSVRCPIITIVALRRTSAGVISTLTTALYAAPSPASTFVNASPAARMTVIGHYRAGLRPDGGRLLRDGLANAAPVSNATLSSSRISISAAARLAQNCDRKLSAGMPGSSA